MVVLCILSVTGSEVRHYILFHVYSDLIKVLLMVSSVSILLFVIKWSKVASITSIVSCWW